MSYTQKFKKILF